MKLLTEKEYNKISDQLGQTPCILIAGCEDGRPHFSINAPIGKNEVITEMLLAVMAHSPDFANCIRCAAVAHRVRRDSN